MRGSRRLEDGIGFTRGSIPVANIKSAAKRARQAEVRRQHNIALKSKMRTSIKKVIKAIDAGDANSAAEQYKLAVPDIDRMAGKGLIQANKAARHKSRLNKAIKGLSAGS
jgi:small subunit ribosomal protein S20